MKNTPQQEWSLCYIGILIVIEQKFVEEMSPRIYLPENKNDTLWFNNVMIYLNYKNMNYVMWAGKYIS